MDRLFQQKRRSVACCQILNLKGNQEDLEYEQFCDFEAMVVLPNNLLHDTILKQTSTEVTQCRIDIIWHNWKIFVLIFSLKLFEQFC